ncbi:MAG TPA: hypothetical protein VFJ58_05160 [Armatimonadota bacterium]|nr:hypothetical protein [Armatimonadota bacterium]
MTISVACDDVKLENRLRQLQYTPEERARILCGAEPFDLAKWKAEAPPASEEELAEMEEFLKDREREREISLERDTGCMG